MRESLDPSRFFLIQRPTPPCRNERRQRARRGGNREVAKLWTPSNFVALWPRRIQGRRADGNQRRGSLRSASNASEAASEERDTLPVCQRVLCPGHGGSAILSFRSPRVPRIPRPRPGIDSGTTKTV